jgi:hypothetical protein
MRARAELLVPMVKAWSTDLGVDPEKMIAARETGVSEWVLHERSVAGKFAPTTPYAWRGSF